MYVNPVLVGVLGTLAVELLLTVGLNLLRGGREDEEVKEDEEAD